MMKLLSEQVFKPGAFPDYTYVSRISPELNFNYEIRLMQALKISGCLTSIVGPSKMGKTVLCEKVIEFEKLVEVSGGDFTVRNDFWKVLSIKVGLALEGEYSETHHSINEKAQKGLSRTERYIASKDKVIEYFKEEGKVLVLDDFHYAPEEVQVYIAQQLKDAIRKEFKAIVVTLPHRADDAIRKNADLSGRLSLINIEPWTADELKQIAIKGFKELNAHISDEIATRIATESLTSPQLMQYICLSISTLIDLDNETGERIVDETKLEDSFKFTTLNFEYRDVIKTLKEGPNTRGKQRKIFDVITGEFMDVYGLIMKSLEDNPPLMELSLDELKTRIDILTENSVEKVDKKRIKDGLNQLQSIINEKETIFQVFEWKENMLYILEPLFLFYLRWGVH
ncbi:TniB family NTP-binding protein [Clostridium grantii]|uniref:AAA domain-containing protein n=1 Tax=Clostridium grantii DSM 8605 TaxID=1121316 RepID=A0A1M5W6L1_9CLOT|nr:TniB family NTP-binding protein [Clostridium grantii]SHH83152.1 hypothetical protein SAMN02745207_02711 [Clostridium grantii DSM 8605]